MNTDSDGNAHCIKAGYFKMGWTNFTREWGGETRRIHSDRNSRGL